MAWPNIDVNTPSGSEKKKFGDDRIREAKGNLVDALEQVSNYSAAGSTPALRTAVWDTAGRPSGANLVDRVCGYNSDLGYEEYYNLATTTWNPLGSGYAHDHTSTGETKIPTDGIADGALSADAAGRAKMADGYLSADASGRAKMADGFITASKMASGALGNNIAIRMGTISHGGTIPLPDGYTQEQCFWMVSMNDDNPSGSKWDIEEGGSFVHYRFQCYADSNRVVTARCYHGAGSSSGWINGTANYLIIGIK